MTKLISAAQWAIANKDVILAAIASVIAGVSALIKAFEVCVALLLRFFPQMQGVDGKLFHLAAFFDGLSKSKLLNAVALSPKQ